MTASELRPPGAVVEIAERLERAGHETWCVGGAVRDALLSHLHLDWDLATAATPPEVQALFRRTKPIGVAFGTVGVIGGDGRMHEVTTFRRDVRTDGRHAVVEFGASLDEDLARRDFTINAIAWHPLQRKLHDPFGGREDLRRRLVRAVGDPDARMREDRLRALRAIRFAGRFGFRIDPDTWGAIVASAPHLGRLSSERVRQEIEKTLEQVDRPSQSFRLWIDSGAMLTLVPTLARLGDVQLATLDHLAGPVLARRPQRLVTRLAALFLDGGDGTARQTLRALRFSNQDADWVAGLAAAWAAVEPRVRQALAAERAVEDAEIRRWVASVGRLRLVPIARLLGARWCAMRAAGLDAPDAAAMRGLHRRWLRIAFRDPVELADLAIDGDDLRRAGIAPGPEMGRILHAVLDLVLEDPSLNTPDALLAFVRELRSGGND